MTQCNEPIRNPGAALSALRAACMTHPDQRMGQVIVNALGADPFYVEDDDAEAKLYAYAQAGARSAALPGDVQVDPNSAERLDDACALLKARLQAEAAALPGEGRSA